MLRMWAVGGCRENISRRNNRSPLPLCAGRCDVEIATRCASSALVAVCENAWSESDQNSRLLLSLLG